MFIIDSSEETQADHFSQTVMEAPSKHPKQILSELTSSSDDTNVNWIDDNTVEVSCISGLCVHSFALELEKMGKKVSYEKKTFIKIA